MPNESVSCFYFWSRLCKELLKHNSDRSTVTNLAFPLVSNHFLYLGSHLHGAAIKRQATLSISPFLFALCFTPLLHVPRLSSSFITHSDTIEVEKQSSVCVCVGLHVCVCVCSGIYVLTGKAILIVSPFLSSLFRAAWVNLVMGSRVIISLPVLSINLRAEWLTKFQQSTRSVSSSLLHIGHYLKTICIYVIR